MPWRALSQDTQNTRISHAQHVLAQAVHVQHTLNYLTNVLNNGRISCKTRQYVTIIARVLMLIMINTRKMNAEPYASHANISIYCCDVCVTATLMAVVIVVVCMMLPHVLNSVVMVLKGAVTNQTHHYVHCFSQWHSH